MRLFIEVEIIGRNRGISGGLLGPQKPLRNIHEGSTKAQNSVPRKQLKAQGGRGSSVRPDCSHATCAKAQHAWIGGTSRQQTVPQQLHHHSHTRVPTPRVFSPSLLSLNHHITRCSSQKHQTVTSASASAISNNPLGAGEHQSSSVVAWSTSVYQRHNHRDNKKTKNAEKPCVIAFY